MKSRFCIATKFFSKKDLSTIETLPRRKAAGQERICTLFMVYAILPAYNINVKGCLYGKKFFI